MAAIRSIHTAVDVFDTRLPPETDSALAFHSGFTYPAALAYGLSWWDSVPRPPPPTVEDVVVVDFVVVVVAGGVVVVVLFDAVVVVVLGLVVVVVVPLVTVPVSAG